MPGFTIQRSGFTRVPELFYAIITDLVANGFTQKFPSSPVPIPVPGTPMTVFKATLEAGLTVNSLSATQPWRIQFNATAMQAGDVYVTTPLQAPDDGTISNLDVVDSGGVTALPSGLLNTMGRMSNSGDPAPYHFLDRSLRITLPAQAGAYPMSYRLTVTSHGIALFVWEDATDNRGTQFSWVVVQRPVDHVTGTPLVTGQCPVFCVFGLLGQPFKYIVREADVLKPTLPVPADVNGPDSRSILNSLAQVAITENNRYVITFPNGINTPRFAYTEELDLVAYTSADVVSQYSDVPITVYGEVAARTYKAMNANGPNNTGMRMLMLTSGKPML